MDEMVTVGLAGLAGLVIIAIAAIVAVFWIGGLVITAYIAGDWQALGLMIGIIAVFFTAYTGTGMWLQKTGRI